MSETENPAATQPVVATTQSVLPRLTSRKFMLVVAAFATFTGLRIAGLLDQTGYITVSVFVLGAYLGVNVTQKAIQK